MKTLFVRMLSVAVIFVAVRPQALDAQAASTRFPTRWSIEASVAKSGGHGGNPRAMHANGGVADIGVTLGLREGSAGTLLAAATYGLHLDNGKDATCPVDPVTMACVPDYPEFSGPSFLAGWQTPRPERGSLRLLAGPGLYRANNRDIGNTLGWLARLDIASPTLMGISLVGSARATVVPNAEGTRYRQTAFGLGLRIH
jgi:hypothetical protein